MVPSTSALAGRCSAAPPRVDWQRHLTGIILQNLKSDSAEAVCLSTAHLPAASLSDELPWLLLRVPLHAPLFTGAGGTFKHPFLLVPTISLVTIAYTARDSHASVHLKVLGTRAACALPVHCLCVCEGLVMQHLLIPVLCARVLLLCL
jgi:hypothetical protein